MKTALRRTLIVLAAILIAVLALVPVVVPPAVELMVRSKIAEVGLFADVRMTLDYCWRNGPGVSGSLSVAVCDSPWRVKANFGASVGEWSADVKMAKTTFDENDPTIRTLLGRYPVAAVSNLVFSGSIALDAHAERTFRKPVPVWSAKAPVHDLSVGFVANDTPFSLTGLSVTPAASGIADHVDVAPMFPRIRALTVDGFTLTNFHASVRGSERAVIVTEASARCCGGTVSLFSAFLDPKNLSTGFTLFLDDIDAGEVLAHFRGFRGEASGRLHGKVKLFLRDGGKSVRLSDAFLYSTPGEGGKLKMSDATPVTDNLALAGIDEATRDNVANALADLDYSALKLNLRRNEGAGATLTTRLKGTATRGDLTVPVDITLNFNGELEQIINTGLGYSRL